MRNRLFADLLTTNLEIKLEINSYWIFKQLNNHFCLKTFSIPNQALLFISSKRSANHSTLDSIKYLFRKPQKPNDFKGFSQSPAPSYSSSHDAMVKANRKNLRNTRKYSSPRRYLNTAIWFRSCIVKTETWMTRFLVRKKFGDAHSWRNSVCHFLPS